MKTVIFLYIFLLLFLPISCSKDEQKKDTELPVIFISNPINNQTFSNGQSIPITGTITDNEYIAEVHIHVSNANTGALLMDVHKFPAAATLTFNESITAAAGVNYKIQVVAKDRQVNEATSAVTVSCN